MNRTTRRKTVVAVLATTLAATGCGINPYVRTKGIEASLPSSTIEKPRFAGDLEQAIADVDAQRLAYYDHLDKRTVQRNLLSGGLIALSAGALYYGVTASTVGPRRAVVNAGALAGGAYALGSYSNSPNTELAYLNAANDLTCLVLRTRPWLVKQDDEVAFTSAVDDLLKKTNAFDALFQKQISQSDTPRDFLRHHPFEQKMLYNARVTLRKASNFKGAVDSAGFQLRQEAVLASNLANFEIHRLQPELANPSSIMVGLRNTNQVFKDIKPLDVPKATDQTDGSPAAGSDGTPTNAGASTTKSSPPAAAAKPPATPEAASTAISDLGKQADKLSAKVIEQTALLEAEQKTNKAQAEKTQAELKKLSQELHGLSKTIADLKRGETAKLTVIDDAQKTAAGKAAAEKLAEALSDVLAAMRPVNATLQRAYSLKPYVKSIPECQPREGQTFEFAFEPGEVTLTPGQSFEVAVKGGVGVPHIWLSGAKGNEKGEMPTFTTSIDGGIARAKLTILSTTPPGEMHIFAVDGSGKQRDDIKVIVEAKAAGK